MAIGNYIGIGGVPKIADPYIGIADVPKEVLAVYVGDANNIPRLTFGGITPAGRIVFTSSQPWTVPAGVTKVDVFCVGGGENGGSYSEFYSSGTTSQNWGRGGCGGQVATLKSVSVTPNQSCNIIVGAGGVNGAVGGDSSALGCTAKAYQYIAPTYYRGSGGGVGQSYWDGGPTTTSSSSGGSDGSSGGNYTQNYNGSVTTQTVNNGSLTTTREFGESGNTLYSGGGGGASNNYGGAGGGGNANSNATPNTGSGAGGSSSYGKISGASGVVIVRWERQ